jgi:hypothetical protein
MPARARKLYRGRLYITARPDGRVADVALRARSPGRVARVGLSLEKLIFRLRGRGFDDARQARPAPDGDEPDDDAQDDVQEREVETVFLGQSQRLVFKGREGRVRTDEADGDGEPQVRAQVQALGRERQEKAEVEGACDVDDESGRRERRGRVRARSVLPGK